MKTTKGLLVGGVSLSLIIGVSTSSAALLVNYTFDNSGDRTEDIAGTDDEGLPGGGANANTYMATTVAGNATTVLNTEGSVSNGWAINNGFVPTSTTTWSLGVTMKTTDTVGYLFGQRNDVAPSNRFIITPASVHGFVYNGVRWYGVGNQGKGGTKTAAERQADFIDGNWHHFAATVDGLDVKIYRDGVLYETITMDETGSALSNSPSGQIFNHRFGSDGDGQQHILGMYDDIRLYDHVLTPTEVADINTIPEPAVSLLGGFGILILMRRRRIQV